MRASVSASCIAPDRFLWWSDGASGLGFFATTSTPGTLFFFFFFFFLFFVEFFFWFFLFFFFYVSSRTKIHIGNVTILDVLQLKFVNIAAKRFLRFSFWFDIFFWCSDWFCHRMCDALRSPVGVGPYWFFLYTSWSAYWSWFCWLSFGKLVFVTGLGRTDHPASSRYIKPKLRIVMWSLCVFFAIFPCHEICGVWVKRAFFSSSLHPQPSAGQRSPLLSLWAPVTASAHLCLCLSM